MSLQAPKFILFDLDGTLLDSLPGIVHSVSCACRAVGVAEPASDLRMLLGPPIRSIFATVLRTQDAELLDRLEAAFRSNYDTEGWRKTRCFAGTRELLETLRGKGCRLFVVSNKPRHISLRILEWEGIESFFEKVYTRDSRRPAYGSKAEMVRDFLDEAGVSASECLLVGDTVEDIRASAANGMAAALMEHGYGEVPQDVQVRYRLRGFAGFMESVAMENAG